MQLVYSLNWATGHSLWGRISPLCRDAVGVNQLGQTLVGGGGSYPFAEKQSVYSAAPASWATGHSLVGVLSLCRDAVGVNSTGPQDTRWGGGILPLCRGAVGVNQLGQTLIGGGGSYPFVEKQSVYSTATADWARLHLNLDLRTEPKCEACCEVKITIQQ